MAPIGLHETGRRFKPFYGGLIERTYRGRTGWVTRALDIQPEYGAASSDKRS